MGVLFKYLSQNCEIFKLLNSPFWIEFTIGVCNITARLKGNDFMVE